MTMTYAEAATKWRASLPLTVGYGALAILVGVLGVWAVCTTISGAVVSPGVIEVARHKQVIQHPTGGVVGEILAHDGDSVKAGDVLVRLDARLLKSQLAVIESQLVEVLVRKARLEAERDNAKTIILPRALDDLRPNVPGADAQVAGQQRLFRDRLAALETEGSQIDEQIGQITHQIEGTEAQLAALQEQLSLVSETLAKSERLLKQSLIESTRVNDQRSNVAGLKGQIGRAQSQVAELRGQIAALKIQKLQLGNRWREDASSQLRDLATQEVELGEKRFAMLETLSDLDIRASSDGVVYGSKVFALQSVIQPAEPIMYIVPQEKDLVITARIEASDIDKVHAYQETRLRFSAFDHRTTPELEGHVLSVSADIFNDEATGHSFYKATVAPDPGQTALLGARELLPGMPVQVFIRTEDRTPFSYFVKPLADYFIKAFRE